MVNPSEVTPYGGLASPDYRGSEAKTGMIKPVKKKIDRRAETQATDVQSTAPQLQRYAESLKARMASGELAEGNVEMAALLGFKPAQIALGREGNQGMSPGQLIQFLLTDPNLKIDVGVSGP